MAKYSKAPISVVETAQMLINKHHPTLISADIGFIFRDKATYSKGRVVLGKAKKVQEWMKLYKSLDFIIEIAADTYSELNDEAKVALIDHELCHCKMDEDSEGEPRPYIVGHDIEEFADIIDRYGFWNTSLFFAQKKIVQAAQKFFPTMEVERAQKEGSVTALSAEDIEAMEEI